MISDNWPIVIVIAVVVVIVLLAGWLARRRPRGLNRAYFNERWQEVQKLCSNEDTWPLAVINGDKLVDEALRKSKVKGKTMGERLVSAQKLFKNNDSIWSAHKLRNRLVHENQTKLRKQDTLNALKGFRDALKDLGAM